jgi:hypothetical protein
VGGGELEDVAVGCNGAVGFAGTGREAAGPPEWWGWGYQR